MSLRKPPIAQRGLAWWKPFDPSRCGLSFFSFFFRNEPPIAERGLAQVNITLCYAAFRILWIKSRFKEFIVKFIFNWHHHHCNLFLCIFAQLWKWVILILSSILSNSSLNSFHMFRITHLPVFQFSEHYFHFDLCTT